MEGVAAGCGCGLAGVRVSRCSDYMVLTPDRRRKHVQPVMLSKRSMNGRGPTAALGVACTGCIIFPLKHVR